MYIGLKDHLQKIVGHLSVGLIHFGLDRFRHKFHKTLLRDAFDELQIENRAKLGHVFCGRRRQRLVLDFDPNLRWNFLAFSELEEEAADRSAACRVGDGLVLDHRCGIAADKSRESSCTAPPW